MRNINFILLSISIVLFVGCTNVDDFQETEISQQSKQNKITKNEAVNIADKILKKSALTRTPAEAKVSFDFVISNKSPKTRSASISDTLAYIINYANDEGFAIISTNKNVFPVLAFSEKGNFSCDNENARINFVDKIEEYNATANTGKTYNSENPQYGVCYQIRPFVKTTIGLNAPWDKYVIKEHPDCPVGCVAVATALMLTHSMLELDYHGSKYYFKSIIEAIHKEQKKRQEDSTPIYAEEEWNEAVQPTYTYEQAVDSMAKLLYWLGKDLGIEYKPGTSSASILSGYNLCKQLKEVKDLEYYTFDINKITRLIQHDYIIYIDGRNLEGLDGHAWISDGVAFCVTIDESERVPSQREKIEETYIHCDWGWDGSCNGYYSGSVFKPNEYSFRPSIYFALRRGKNSFINVAP